MKSIRWILVSVIMVVTGQLLLKLGVKGTTFNISDILGSFILFFSNIYVWIGLGIIALSSLAWLKVLSKAELSYAFPMISMGYILVAISSLLLFEEKITLIRWAGIITICLGVFLMSRSEKKWST